MFRKNSDGKNVLDIFENFVVDKTLPKYKRTQELTDQSDGQTLSSILSTNSGNIFISNTSAFTNGTMFINGTQFVPATQNAPVAVKEPVLMRVRKALANLLVPQEKKLPVAEVFKLILSSSLNIKEYQLRYDAYEAAIADAKEMGQTALIEELEENKKLYTIESQLFLLGYKKYITEDLLIDFSIKCEKGLRLDWVKNFSRVIPVNVQKVKRKADAHAVFDNYVILHFDPQNKSNKLTKAEIEKKKDPILFGVIEGSRNLYMIADWKDQYCDLTFDQLVEAYGKDKLTLK